MLSDSMAGEGLCSSALDRQLWDKRVLRVEFWPKAVVLMKTGLIQACVKRMLLCFVW